MKYYYVAGFVLLVLAGGALYYTHSQSQKKLVEQMLLEAERIQQEKIAALKAEMKLKAQQEELAQAKLLEEERKRAAEEAIRAERARVAAEEKNRVLSEEEILKAEAEAAERKRTEERLAAEAAEQARIAEEARIQQERIEKDRIATQALLQRQAYSRLVYDINYMRKMAQQLQKRIDDRFYTEDVVTDTKCQSCHGSGRIGRPAGTHPRVIPCRNCNGRGTVETVSQVKRERDVRRETEQLRMLQTQLAAKEQALRELAQTIAQTK